LAPSPYSPTNAGLFGSGLSTPFGSLAPSSNVNALSSWLATPATPPHLWFYVIRRFQTILGNITITDAQREDGEKKHAGVRAALNRHYWNVASETANSCSSALGARTRVSGPRAMSIFSSCYRPASTIDTRPAPAIVNLPCCRRSRKSCARPIVRPRPLRADGQVVLFPFNTMPVEVSVGFRCTNGSIIYCDTNDGGSYKTSTAEAEADDLRTANLICNARAKRREPSAMSKLFKGKT
jgi:hypothetical protein